MNMNLLIVDDEPLIHKSIEYCLGELEDSSVTVYHAYNGSDMLKQLKELTIHIALVDIRMPGTNGLEAIDAAREQWPDIDYYIMSGFSEFEYAREAVRLGVTEYLLKPLSPDDLTKVLKKRQKKEASLLQHTRNSFRTWLEGGLHRHEVDYLYTSGYYTGLILLTYDYKGQEPLFWVPECVEAWHEHILSLACEEGILLLVFSPESALTHKIIHQFPRRDFPRGVTAFVSSICRDSSAALTQLHKLIHVSCLRVFHGIEKRYDQAFFPPAAEKEHHQAMEWLPLKEAYAALDYKAYISLQFRLQQAIKKNTRPTYLSAIAEYAGCVFDKALEAAPDALLRELEAGEKFLLHSHNKSVDKITAVLQYIDEHYCEELSIAALADMYELSPNYLSTLLKNHQGVKFTDYITRLRITRAKELLLTTSLSVKEISEQVGYHSQSHFTRVFLESENHTPIEFKKLFSGSSAKE